MVIEIVVPLSVSSSITDGCRGGANLKKVSFTTQTKTACIYYIVCIQTNPLPFSMGGTAEKFSLHCRPGRF